MIIWILNNFTIYFLSDVFSPPDKWKKYLITIANINTRLAKKKKIIPIRASFSFLLTHAFPIIFFHFLIFSDIVHDLQTISYRETKRLHAIRQFTTLFYKLATTTTMSENFWTLMAALIPLFDTAVEYSWVS